MYRAFGSTKEFSDGYCDPFELGVVSLQRGNEIILEQCRECNAKDVSHSEKYRSVQEVLN